MGVERSVTRWYILRQPLLLQIAELEAQLQKKAAEDSATTRLLEENTQNLEQQLAEVREKLRLLGPCPKPMMG